MRMTRKKVMVILAILILALILIFFSPSLGKQTKKMEVYHRVKALQSWHGRISEYYQQNKRLPENLYEVRNVFAYLIPTSSRGDLRPDKASDDPICFEQIVEYAFMKYRGGWSVVETRGGTLDTSRLMIDDKGDVYKILNMNETQMLIEK